LVLIKWHNKYGTPIFCAIRPSFVAYGDATATAIMLAATTTEDE
jgi:hypothetical protein